MEIDDALFTAARRGRREPTIEVIAQLVPEAFAIATLLTGSFNAGRQAIHRLAVASMRQLPTWTDANEGQRWFRHQAVLVARQIGTRGDDDPQIFARPDSTPPAGFAAFIRAVRLLPQQQQESFLLQHGLGFDARDRGIAMDCSTTAAQLHLQEADRQLAPLLADDYDLMRRILRDGAARLLDVEDPRAFVARRYRRHSARRARDTLLAILVVLAAVGGIAWLAWSIRVEIRDRLMPATTRPDTSAPTTQPETATPGTTAPSSAASVN